MLEFFVNTFLIRTILEFLFKILDLFCVTSLVQVYNFVHFEMFPRSGNLIRFLTLAATIGLRRFLRLLGFGCHFAIMVVLPLFLGRTPLISGVLADLPVDVLRLRLSVVV